ncbi:hypothetical protein DQ04_03911030 [Trypanosoma grayi]|uniref:hypothetical protein n=1 Tax=Trypanosoma grayi TaxID=71804 RepID=UPI0004F40B10|nr:hypothetical protein DQ04_03911030 [Trypanosoma grayi]KEG10304.1 hypothetical protein DQ04_03911030 [Trypanosoma grayi]
MSTAASATSSLRWVKYEDVYYAALVVPDDEAPTQVQSGHAFVYFLGSESGAVVPISDMQPYDPHDTERTSHPAAAAGVAVAQQIISGAATAAAGGEEDMEGEEELLDIPVKNRTKAKGYLDDDDNDDVEKLLPSRQGGTKRPRSVAEEEEQEESDETSSSRSSSSSSHVSSEEKAQRSRWNDMAEDLDLTPPQRGNGGNNSGSNRRSAGGVGVSSGQKSRESVLDAYGGSIVTPFLAEIHHHYRKALMKAAESDRVVNMQESDIVRAVEAELLAWRGEVAYLQRLLQDVEGEYRAVAAAAPHDAAVLEEEAAAIRSRLQRLRSSFNLERVVEQQLRVRDKVSERRERRRHGGVSSSAFTDASLAFILDAKAFAAVPRELPQQLAQRYREQRMRRERLLASQHGLGKTGFTAPVARVMEKWRQARELIVLDPLRENQPVSRRYSESLAKVERHALKCLSASQGLAHRLTSGHGAQHQQQQQQQQQQRMHTPASLYRFHDMHDDERQVTTATYQPSSSHPYMLSSAMPDDNHNNLNGDGDGERDAFQAPLISPLHMNFDPRATFAVDLGEIVHENTLAEQLAMRSMQYSHSIRLPSQESVWEESEAYDAPLPRRRRTGRSTSRAGSLSRASSRASSLGRDDRNNSKITTDNNNNNNVNNNNKSGGERRPRNDWRASAKRAILEHLTLYLRGIRGKPAVLSKDQFQSIAKKLLERAVRSESERTGLSMSLQANNASAPFTKDIEGRLRRSVDNYVQRHFIAARTPREQQQQEDGEASVERWASARRGTAQRQDDNDEDTRSVMGAYPHATDSPVYDQ